MITTPMTMRLMYLRGCEPVDIAIRCGRWQFGVIEMAHRAGYWFEMWYKPRGGDEYSERMCRCQLTWLDVRDLDQDAFERLVLYKQMQMEGWILNEWLA